MSFHFLFIFSFSLHFLTSQAATSSATLSLCDWLFVCKAQIRLRYGCKAHNKLVNHGRKVFFVDYLELSSNQHFATLFFRPFRGLEDIVILNTIEEFRFVSQDPDQKDQKLGKSYDLTTNTIY